MAALDKFSYPAARVKSTRGSSTATIDDLLTGIVKDANKTAIERGAKVGMSDRTIFDLI